METKRVSHAIYLRPARPLLGLFRQLGIPAALLTMALTPQAECSAASARTVIATGTLEPVATVTIGSTVSGIVQDVTCDFNTIVKKGQVCAKIDPRPFQKAVDLHRAAIATANAQLALHKAALAYAKASHDRNLTLFQRGVVSQDGFENIQANYQQLKSQVDLDGAMIAQRQAELESAELNLSYTDIVSPIDGVILVRKIATGESVAASLQSPVLFVIASDLSRIRLVARVGEGEIGTLKAGDEASFTVKAFAQRNFTATVVHIRPNANVIENEVRYDVILEVDNSDLMLKPGMNGSVRINASGS